MDRTEYYTLLGQATDVIMDTRAYMRYPLAWVRQRLRPPILLHQIQFLSDMSGGVVGFMTWAYLAEDTEQRWIRDPSTLLHLSE